MNEQPLSRRDRIARVRMRVVAGATALFLATLAGVIALGRQPATKVATAAASSKTTTTTTQTYDDNSAYSDDSGSYSTTPSPMTTRSS